MQSAMTRYFIPPNYKQRAHLQFTQLVQGSYSVDEYTNKFYSLAMRSGFPWNEDVMISKYRQGLNPNISLGLAASRLYTMADAIQIAYQMEEETKKKALMRAPMASNIRGERTIVDVNLEKSIDKSKGNSYQPNKNVRSNTSTSQGSSSNSRAKCFNFGGFGHMSFQCPSKLVAMLERDSPSLEAIKGSKQLEIQEEICEPLNANLKENVEDPDLADVGMLNIVNLILMMRVC